MCRTVSSSVCCNCRVCLPLRSVMNEFGYSRTGRQDLSDFWMDATVNASRAFPQGTEA